MPAIACNSMVTTSSVTRRPFGIARDVATEHAHGTRRAAGGIARLSRSMSAWVAPVNVGERRDYDTRGNARQQNRLEVRARLGVRRQVREDARVEDVEQTRQLGVRDAVGEELVLGRR